MNKNQILTELIVDCPPKLVWQVLTDLATWSEWNPFIVSAVGKAEVGEVLINTFSNQGKKMVFKPVVTKVNEVVEFEWVGKAFLGGFQGRHYFLLSEVEDGKTKLIHGEEFSGWMVPLILPLVKKNSEKGFVEMNKALMERVRSLKAQ